MRRQKSKSSKMIESITRFDEAYSNQEACEIY
jgi:hypothetical protein